MFEVACWRIIQKRPDLWIGQLLGAVRARPTSIGQTGTQGNKICDVPVDFGVIAIADFDQIRASLDEYKQRDLNKTAVFLMNVDFCLKKQIKVGSNLVEIIISRSDFGDGTYPVFAVESDRHVVGFEVVSIADGYVLP